MKALSIIGYLRYPLETIRQFLVAPRRAVRNTFIVLSAFWLTLVVGRRLIRVLKGRHPSRRKGRVRKKWKESTLGRYTWQVAQKYWAGWILDRAGIQLRIVGYERVDWSRPHVIVANHASTVDILALVAVVPNGRYVVKRETLRYPVIGAVARYGAQIIIDRSDHAQAMKAIRQGMNEWSTSNLIFFSEGTRTRTGKIGKFKLGAFAIAQEMGLPIVPIAISGTFRVLREGSLLGLEIAKVVQIEFGRALVTQGMIKSDVIELARRVRDQIIQMLGDEAI